MGRRALISLQCLCVVGWQNGLCKALSLNSTKMVGLSGRSFTNPPPPSPFFFCFTLYPFLTWTTRRVERERERARTIAREEIKIEAIIERHRDRDGKGDRDRNIEPGRQSGTYMKCKMKKKRERHTGIFKERMKKDIFQETHKEGVYCSILSCWKNGGCCFHL